jgi:LytS/YehU family sensor histidine kinase
MALTEVNRPAASADQVRTRPATFAGILGGLVGATCCIGPAVGIATGAGAGSFLLSMGRYRPLLFVVGGIVAFAIAAVLLRRSRRTCRIPAKEARSLRARWIDVTLIAFALTYGIGRFVVASVIRRL